MNFQTLSDNINLFKEEIINSGFKRDIQDYVNSLPTNQNNILALREVANKIHIFIEKLNNTEFSECLRQLLPDKKNVPFTDTKVFEQLTELINDNQVDLSNFFQRLNQITSQLNQYIDKNLAKINEIEVFISPYLSKETEEIATEHRAIVSIIFKESNTVSNLKHFTKSITSWNRTLPMYHQLIKSSSPEDIKIIQVQNGSIDFVFNFDIDIALNLVELFKEGFKLYLAYLTYKTMSKPIKATFFGNKALIEKQKEVEDGLLDNIALAVAEKIKEQHLKAKEIDKKIDGNIDKKVEQVTNLITSHIINGNDIKLLSLPIYADEPEDKTKEKETLKKEVREVSSEVRNLMKSISTEERKVLLDKFGKFDDTE